MNVFYDRFARHAHAEGLKARSTHYCPGCGHGLVHKYLAAAIQDLGVQDRTIAISPVGCAVFLHYYLDVGHSQAAHGRAPAVALGHKLANPDAIVVSYQGDGDLAAIGLAEILQAAQLGIPITVLFVNNAIYGMTGGQMAPTTLMGQGTATSPGGRTRLMGAPLRMAEIIAGLDGPVYVERVALYDAKQRVRAQKAIRKALGLQVKNAGFAFVEVLAECPLHIEKTPEETQRWVRDAMVPVFPLGVKKDLTPAPWSEWKPPSFEPERLTAAMRASHDDVPRFCRRFPKEPYGADIALKIAGAGGDGAQTAAWLVARAAINEGFDATHIPSYGPESRGGTSYADVRLAETEVLNPAAPEPHVLIAFNGPSLAKFAPRVAPGGSIVYDSSLAVPPAQAAPGVRTFGIPCTRIATDLGDVVVKNSVALGALQVATEILPAETFLAAMAQVLGEKPKLMALNQQAFERGRAAVAAQIEGGVMLRTGRNTQERLVQAQRGGATAPRPGRS